MESTNTISVVVTDPVAASSTASATSAGQLVASVSQILSPVATPAQSSVAGPSSIYVGSFYSTRAATCAAPRTVPSTASPAVPQIGKGKGKGKGKGGKWGKALQLVFLQPQQLQVLRRLSFLMMTLM